MALADLQNDAFLAIAEEDLQGFYNEYLTLARKQQEVGARDNVERDQGDYFTLGRERQNEILPSTDVEILSSGVTISKPEGGAEDDLYLDTSKLDAADEGEPSTPALAFEPSKPEPEPEPEPHTQAQKPESKPQAQIQKPELEPQAQPDRPVEYERPSDIHAISSALVDTQPTHSVEAVHEEPHFIDEDELTNMSPPADRFIDEDELTNISPPADRFVDEDELTNMSPPADKGEEEDMWTGFDTEFPVSSAAGGEAAPLEIQEVGVQPHEEDATVQVSPVIEIMPQPSRLEINKIKGDDSDSLSSDDGDAHAGWSDDKDFLHDGGLDDDDEVDLMVHHYHVG
jgi:hypothetical protein